MKNRNRNGATILGVVLLSILVAMLASAGLRAEGTRSISAVPDSILYIRTANSLYCLGAKGQPVP